MLSLDNLLDAGSLKPGDTVWIRATVNEENVQSGQPLVGVTIEWNDGKRRTMHVSVPTDVLSVTDMYGDE